MNEQHKHWKVIGYNEINEEGNYIQPVSVTIMDALSEEWAIQAAGKIAKRKNYVLNQVWECYDCDPYKILKTKEMIDKQIEFLDQNIDKDE